MVWQITYNHIARTGAGQQQTMVVILRSLNLSLLRCFYEVVLLRLNVDETEFDYNLSGYWSHELCLFLALKINVMFSSIM